MNMDGRKILEWVLNKSVGWAWIRTSGRAFVNAAMKLLVA
jgi:hypothetical protein